MEGTLQNENKLVGTLSSGNAIVGGLGTVIARDGKDGVDGKSAYEIWLDEGNTGTEAEFLASLKGADGTMTFEDLTEEQKASLKGDKGDKGDTGIYLGSGDMPDDCFVQIDPNGTLVTIEQILAMIPAATSRISSVTLLSDNWIGTESPYYQTVTVEGVTANSQVDLTPSAEQLEIFYNKDLTLTTKNLNGVVTVYAFGQKPMNDYTIQVTITEVIR